jgi:hypothetical protein
MKPIPKKLLIHTVIHKTGKSVDEWENPTWATSTTISHVRVESTRKLVLNKTNQEVQLSLLLFHDLKNSFPAAESYALGDAITFDGTDYTITTIDKLYNTNQQAHHLELGLI